MAFPEDSWCSLVYLVRHSPNSFVILFCCSSLHTGFLRALASHFGTAKKAKRRRQIHNLPLTSMVLDQFNLCVPLITVVVTSSWVIVAFLVWPRCWSRNSPFLQQQLLQIIDTDQWQLCADRRDNSRHFPLYARTATRTNSFQLTEQFDEF